MKSGFFGRMIRLISVLLGAGAAAALVWLALHLAQTYRGAVLPLWQVSLLLIGSSAIGGGAFYLLAPRIERRLSGLRASVEARLERMEPGQMAGGIGGLIVGLLIAALVAQLFGLLGGGLVAMLLVSMLYLLLAAIGWTVGWKRGDELARHFHAPRWGKMKLKKANIRKNEWMPLIDLSALTDGRVVGIARAGFLGRQAAVPAFVVDQLRHMADDADEVKRMRGQRGLATLSALQGLLNVHQLTDHAPWDTEPERRVLLLAASCRLPVLTCSTGTIRQAAPMEVVCMNLHELAVALRPTVAAGDHLQVLLVKPGKEPGQGVGYLEDGTMLVAEQGGDAVGQTVEVEVSSALQTQAGRMVFGKVVGKQN